MQVWKYPVDKHKWLVWDFMDKFSGHPLRRVRDVWYCIIYPLLHLSQPGCGSNQAHLSLSLYPSSPAAPAAATSDENPKHRWNRLSSPPNPWGQGRPCKWSLSCKDAAAQSSSDYLTEDLSGLTYLLLVVAVLLSVRCYIMLFLYMGMFCVIFVGLFDLSGFCSPCFFIFFNWEVG